jgi:hypothetical protein
MKIFKIGGGGEIADTIDDVFVRNGLRVVTTSRSDDLTISGRGIYPHVPANFKKGTKATRKSGSDRRSRPRPPSPLANLMSSKGHGGKEGTSAISDDEEGGTKCRRARARPRLHPRLPITKCGKKSE